jgi:hypothetical protein
VTRDRLPIMRTLAAAYRDWRRAILALPALALCAFLILVALSAGEEFFPKRLWDQELAGWALGLAEDALWALLLAPVVIAIHRFVIQNVVMPTYTLPLGDPTYRLFFVWLLALKILDGLAFDLLGVMQALAWPLWASTLGLALALIASIAVSLRLTLLLPALAVHAPGATAVHALADSKGQALRLCAVFTLALLPWLAVDLAGVLLLGRRIEVTGSPPMIIGLIMGGLLQTIVLTLCAVIASLAFRLLADAVNRAPKLALAHPVTRRRPD